MQRFAAFSALLYLYSRTSMKKTLCCLALLLSLQLYGQTDTARTFIPKLTVKWAPTGLILGNVALQGEYNFGGKQSLTVKLGFPKNTTHDFEYDGSDADFDMKATSFLAGYRMYLSKKKHMKGWYWEPFFKYVHHSSEGFGTGSILTREVHMQFTNDYNAAGVGVQLGMQFLIKQRVVVDIFLLGPEINAASNNMKAVEIGNALPWTSYEAEDARKTVVEFIDQFPFLRNKTTIMVDRSNKTVNADFKGALPGLRTGISFGIAF